MFPIIIIGASLIWKRAIYRITYCFLIDLFIGNLYIFCPEFFFPKIGIETGFFFSNLGSFRNKQAVWLVFLNVYIFLDINKKMEANKKEISFKCLDCRLDFKKRYITYKHVSWHAYISSVIGLYFHIQITFNGSV